MTNRKKRLKKGIESIQKQIEEHKIKKLPKFAISVSRTPSIYCKFLTGNFSLLKLNAVPRSQGIKPNFKMKRENALKEGKLELAGYYDGEIAGLEKSEKNKESKLEKS